ncbi:MAG TPA: shikimate kinase, partial [Candidatus Binatus sp.]|nr:shikimate kinase [Candidatus Binatus sp.]
MDVVLVGLPGSGKTAVGRVLATRLGATFVDLDGDIEATAGATIQELFDREGEPGFRAREREAVERLGPPHAGPGVARVIAAGGGTVVDPRNRWRLYRERRGIWLDAATDVLVARLRSTTVARPLLAGGDLVAGLDGLRAARLPFYAACPRIDAEGDPVTVAERVEATVPAGARGPRSRPDPTAPRAGVMLLHVAGPSGR